MNFLLCLLISSLFSSVYLQNNGNKTHTLVDWLCAEGNCTKAISSATVLRKFISNHKEKLSILENTEVKVLKKPNDTHIELWEIEVEKSGKSQKGYVPYRFLKESKVHKKKEELVTVQLPVANDLLYGPSTRTLPSNVNNNGIKGDTEVFKTSTTIAPTPTNEEIINGTPIPLDNYITSLPTQEQSATVVPNANVPNNAIEDHQSNEVNTFKTNDNVNTFENSQEPSNKKKVTVKINENNMGEGIAPNIEKNNLKNANLLNVGIYPGLKISKPDELLEKNQKDSSILQKNVAKGENISINLETDSINVTSMRKESALNVEGSEQTEREEKTNNMKEDGTAPLSGENTLKNTISPQGTSPSNKPDVLPEGMDEKNKEDSNISQITVANSSKSAEPLDKSTGSRKQIELSEEKSENITESDIVTRTVGNNSMDKGTGSSKEIELSEEKSENITESDIVTRTVGNNSMDKGTGSSKQIELSEEKSENVTESDIVTRTVENNLMSVDPSSKDSAQDAETTKQNENIEQNIKESVVISMSVDNSPHFTHVLSKESSINPGTTEESESSEEKSEQNIGDSVKEDSVGSSYSQYSVSEFHNSKHNNIPKQENSIPNPPQTYSSESQDPQPVDSKTESFMPNTHTTESIPSVKNIPFSNPFQNPTQKIKSHVELNQKVDNDNLPSVPISGQHLSSQYAYDTALQDQPKFSNIGPKQEKHSELNKITSDQLYHPSTIENKVQTKDINSTPLIHNNISDKLSEETKQKKDMELVINDKNINSNGGHISEVNGEEDSFEKSTLSDSDVNIVSPPPTESTLISTPTPVESVTETDPMLQLDPIVAVESSPQGEESYFTYLFSSIFSAENSFLDLFKSSELPDVKQKGIKEEVEIMTNEQQPTQPVESTSEVSTNAYCEKDICDQHLAEGVMDSVNRVAEEILTNPVESSLLGFGFIGISTETILLLTITSIVVLIFSLGHYYIENSRRDGDLVAKINSLEGELFLVKKEQTMLDDNVSKANEKADLLRENIKERDDALSVLQRELEEAKGVKATLEETLSRQEKEIETLMENGMEMHKLLSETMSEEERSQMLLANIAELKESLTERLDEIMLLTDQLDHKNQEIQLLQLDLKTSVDKQNDLDNKLSNIQMDVDDQILKAAEPLKLQIIKLEEVIEEKTAEQTRVETEVARLRGRCESLSMRCEVAEKGLQEAQGLKSEEALAKWEDVSSIRSNLLAAENKITSLLDNQDQLLSAKNDLMEKMKDSANELKYLNNKYEMAEKEKIEALTKLQVLSNYFKEKETQLQEELGVKESQWLQKQSEDHTIYEQMRALREENLSYKSQNELLKKEVLEQEASLKKQIANEEQKAHENWVGLRQAERRLKEVQMEAAMLRNRLTALESSSNQNLEDKLNPNGLEANGDGPYQGATSPPFMMFPREFMPPPPLAHATPTRPPPLGRISSPPLPVDFTPPPPLFDLYSSSSPPPPPLHKPQPREGKREQKESMSSTYSSESAPDKSVRRNKR